MDPHLVRFGMSPMLLVSNYHPAAEQSVTVQIMCALNCFFSEAVNQFLTRPSALGMSDPVMES